LRLFKRLKRLLWAGLLGFILFSNWNITSLLAIPPNPSTDHFVPTVPWQNVSLPNWNQISFSSLPAIMSSGSFQAPTEITSQLNYDPSQSWNAGQTPDQFLKLGNFQTSFQLQNFDLRTIAQIVGLDLSSIQLSQIELLNFQTLESLVKAIVGLEEMPIQAIPLLRDLLSSQLTTDFDLNQTLGDLLKQAPLIGQTDFSALDLNSYRLDAIPGLDTTPLGAFQNWQAVSLDGIPGLKDVSFSEFPNPISAVGTAVGTVDIAFGTAEQQRDRTISGSDVEGFSVSCETGCAHIELAGNPTVLGKQWISGKSQQVRGGHGALAAINGGMEPTGRHPFGNGFKVVVWDISEPEGTATLALFFRVCVDVLGCTPYFIGPVPFMQVKEMQPIFLGLIEPGVSASLSTPTNALNGGTQSTFNTESSRTDSGSNSLSYLLPQTPGDCSKTDAGVVLDALSNAISEIEGNYTSVGAYVCDAAGSCGRGLGSKQFMSYRSDVRTLIAAQPGGKQFLSKLDQGASVNDDEMLLYFSPTQQEALFKKDANALINRAAQEIDPTTGQPFQGNRLIERVAQMHFGGPAIPIDDSASDLFNRLTVKSYGSKTAANYQQALEMMGCSL